MDMFLEYLGMGLYVMAVGLGGDTLLFKYNKSFREDIKNRFEEAFSMCTVEPKVLLTLTVLIIWLVWPLTIFSMCRTVCKHIKGPWKTKDK